MIDAIRPPRVNVLGVGVSAINLGEAVALVRKAVDDDIKGYVTVTGVHGVMEAQRDPAFRKILNEAWLVTPDGMPMTWVGRLQGFHDMDRVYGPDLMLDVFEATRDGRVRHFFYGGAPGVAEELRERLMRRFPGVCVCGVYAPPFRPLDAGEEAALIESLRTLRPHIVWIGLSTPKQEKFMAGMVERMPANLMIGVGAAFDFHAGRVAQAPHWMQRAGLEWFFRLLQEPRRLWRRYLVNNPAFVCRICAQLLGVRRYSLD